MAKTMDEAYDPKFSKGTREQKLAVYDQAIADYLAAAQAILDEAKLAKLKARLENMRVQGRAELGAGE